MTEKYQPSNGTEGEGFMGVFCEQCERDREFRDDTGPGCILAARALAFDVDDDLYPAEWTYDAEGKPTCTAFVPIGTTLPTDSELEAAGQLSILEGP